jgi:type VI secretion system secreted protein VgrG
MEAAYLKIGGDLIKDAILVAVEITQELNRHWWCRIECRQTEDKRFPTEQCLGQDVQVLTYDQGGNESVVFDGFIFDVELTYEVWGSYTAQLSAVTRSYAMDQTPRKAYYSEKTLSDVAKELTGHCGLQASVKGPSRKALNYVQWGESDFDFLNRLADDYGCWMRPTAKGIEIANEFQDEITLKWRDEAGLVKFKTKGTLGQPSFNGAHYDPHAMNSKTYKEVSDDARFFDSVSQLVQAVQTQSKKVMPPGYVHQRSRVMKLDDYQSLLKKESVRSIGGNITGHGESRNQQLIPGNKVNIDGELDAHGVYGILKVIHRWTPTGYVNEFWCTPWKDYVNPEAPVMQQWYGLVPARVVEHNDPKKMGRIKVQYFWQEDNHAHWARMVTPHAGGDRGFMFMPEEGDEVVVAFEDGDVERPVVLGSVWNAVDQAPRKEFWGGELENNDIKRMVTKSGNRVQFVDKKGKESMVLATPKDLKISMIESTDETGRPMLTLHSANGDILLSAPNGRIHFHSKSFSREVGE